jgi:hypothetical protein
MNFGIERHTLVNGAGHENAVANLPRTRAHSRRSSSAQDKPVGTSGKAPAAIAVQLVCERTCG